jgi:hypothetical protein
MGPDGDSTVRLDTVPGGAREGVAVDPEVLGRAREVAPVVLNDAGDEPLLELSLRVGEANPLVDHLDDERIQLLLHGSTLP